MHPLYIRSPAMYEIWIPVKQKYEFQWNKNLVSKGFQSKVHIYKNITSSSRSILITSDPLQCISSQWNKNLESQGSPFLLSLRGSQALSSGFLRVCIPSLYFLEDVASNIIQTEFKFSILCPNILQSTGYIDTEGREEISLVSPAFVTARVPDMLKIVCHWFSMTGVLRSLSLIWYNWSSVTTNCVGPDSV